MYGSTYHTYIIAINTSHDSRNHPATWSPHVVRVIAYNITQVTPPFSGLHYVRHGTVSREESWQKQNTLEHNVGQPMKSHGQRRDVGVTPTNIILCGCTMCLMIIRKIDLKEIFCEIVRQPYPNVLTYS